MSVIAIQYDNMSVLQNHVSRINKVWIGQRTEMQ